MSGASALLCANLKISSGNFTYHALYAKIKKRKFKIQMKEPSMVPYTCSIVLAHLKTFL